MKNNGRQAANLTAHDQSRITEQEMMNQTIASPSSASEPLCSVVHTRPKSTFAANRVFTLNEPNAPRLNPALAAEIGLNESIVFLQMEFLIAICHHEYEGKRWTYQSVTDLERIFPFWSRATINRTIQSLEAKRLICIGNFNKAKYDRTRWFAVDLDQAAQLKSLRVAVSDTRSPQGDTAATQNGTGSTQIETPSAQNETTIPESTTEIITENNNKQIRERACLNDGSPTLKPREEKTDLNDRVDSYYRVQSSADQKDPAASCARALSPDELRILSAAVKLGESDYAIRSTLNRLRSSHPPEFYKNVTRTTANDVSRPGNKIKSPAAFLTVSLKNATAAAQREAEEKERQTQARATAVATAEAETKAQDQAETKRKAEVDEHSFTWDDEEISVGSVTDEELEHWLSRCRGPIESLRAGRITLAEFDEAMIHETALCEEDKKSNW
jgi:hypothetical protein